MSNFVDPNDGNGFEIPVVLIFFKRVEKTIQVLDRIAQVRPKKLYLISDGARNDGERELIQECRRRVDERIDWPCEVIRDYAQENRGVYDRIGLGAKRVLSIEPAAIFLEDDNLPEVTFFRFCEEMLSRYKDEERVLWICGTNYLESFCSDDGASYMFTEHMLPCGWASWGHKFLKYYDGDLELLDNPDTLRRIRRGSKRLSLTRQQERCWALEKERIRMNKRPNSWDYQMSLTLRANDLLGVVPCHNQIRNIGVDEFSIHGGNDISNIMTRRFCGMGSLPMQFPLRHPESIAVNEEFEHLMAGIILLPLRYRMLGKMNRFFKLILGIEESEGLMNTIRRWLGLSRAGSSRL